MKFPGSLLILFLTLFSCKEENLFQPGCDFDQEQMLGNYTDSLIIPAFNELESTTGELHELATAFAGDPSPAGLSALRQSLATSWVAFQKVSVFYFGPSREPAIMLNERLNTFPVNITAVENAVAANTSDINALFKSTVGFPALEYLLFGNRDQAQSEDQVLLSFDDSKRLDFLVKLTNDIRSRAAVVAEAWRTGYGQSFRTNTGVAEGSSLSLLVNEFNFDFETLKNFKLKRPLGKFDGGIPQPAKAEGYHSDYGLQLFRENLLQLIAVFRGGTGQGLDDYSNCLDKGINAVPLDQAINSQFAVILEKSNQLQGTLSHNLVNNPAALDELLNEMQKLIPLIKRDMTAEMGVRITYQDNDGD